MLEYYGYAADRVDCAGCGDRADCADCADCGVCIDRGNLIDRAGCGRIIIIAC